jgi:hypothetical protein
MIILFNAAVISRLITILLFSFIGFSLSRKVAAPKRLTWLVGLAVGIIVVGYIGVNTALASIFGAALYLNSLMQGLGIGLFTGFLFKRHAVEENDQEPGMTAST